MLVDVIRRVGDRLIVSPGWAGLGHGLQADDVFVADLPHASLFPQVKAVIHHGGAGTTASALAAGRPTFIVPFAYDQPFWGHRVAAAGAGPRPVYAHRLTAERIGSAIEVLSRRDVRAAAEGIGKHMQAEQAVERGASLVEQLLETERSSSGSSG
jgi:UDP:flavonoid glycosyltransferase YjiC (YdhE family)